MHTYLSMGVSSTAHRKAFRGAYTLRTGYGTGSMGRKHLDGTSWSWPCCRTEDQDVLACLYFLRQTIYLSEYIMLPLPICYLGIICMLPSRWLFMLLYQLSPYCLSKFYFVYAYFNPLFYTMKNSEHRFQ